ncbi:MAG: SOS response-associated peptidase [Acidobacteria bacterium]|nr:SOS response-associated peptidase [Acidobacteriota bacterium]
MCGRYTLTSPRDEIVEYFETDTAPELAARYNLAPSQQSLIVTPAAGGARSARRARRAHWGFTLSRGGKSRLAINARCESADSRPAFRESFASRRCLVPANGFFEWARIGRSRQPYYFTSRESSLVAFAGLWSEDDAGLLTYVILTTAANDVVGRIHDRMPVILRRDHHGSWLEPGSLPGISAQVMFRPWPAADMVSVAVGMRVNDVSCDESDCIKPLVGPVDLFTD